MNGWGKDTPEAAFLRRAKPVSKGRPDELNCPRGSRRLIWTLPPHQGGAKQGLHENRYNANNSFRVSI